MKKIIIFQSGKVALFSNINKKNVSEEILQNLMETFRMEKFSIFKKFGKVQNLVKKLKILGKTK